MKFCEISKQKCILILRSGLNCSAETNKNILVQRSGLIIRLKKSDNKY